MTKKKYYLTIGDDRGVFYHHAVQARLDDEGLRALQRGVMIAQGVDWGYARWTKQEAVDAYIECLHNSSKNELVSAAVETISDLELHEFMIECTSEDDVPDRRADDE